jgi:hypothetical protein
VTRRIPDAPTFRCVRCDGTRLIPLTFAGPRRTWRSELGVRANAKCVTCGCRYAGTQLLVAESALISLAAVADANASAPWGPALAEWGVLLDSGHRASSAQMPTRADGTRAIGSRLQGVLQP